MKRRCVLRRLGGNRRGMEMVQVAILVAIAVTLGIVFRGEIMDFVDKTFNSLSKAKF